MVSHPVEVVPIAKSQPVFIIRGRCPAVERLFATRAAGDSMGMILQEYLCLDLTEDVQVCSVYALRMVNQSWLQTPQECWWMGVCGEA